MTWRKHWLSSLLAGFVVLSVLAGCSSKPAAPPPAANPPAPTSSQPATQPAPAPAPAPAAPEVKTTVVVNYWRPDSAYDGVIVTGTAAGQSKDYKFWTKGDYGARFEFAIFQDLKAIDFKITKDGKEIAKGGTINVGADHSGEAFVINDQSPVFTKAEAEKLKPAKKVIVPPKLAKPGFVLHYFRADGVYTGWDVWSWNKTKAGNGAAYTFDGPDEYGGVKATVMVPDSDPTDKLGIIVRCCGGWAAKDGTQDDRFIDLQNGTGEIFLRSGNPTVFTDPDEAKNAVGPDTVSPGAAPTVAAAQTTVTFHYQRPDGKYDGWDLWVWADGVDGKAFAFTGKDDYGAVANVVIPKGVAKVNYIVRQGGDKWTAKDPDADRAVDTPDGTGEVWLLSGKAEVTTKPAAKDTQVTIHYNRPDGKYDGWDLWVWGDGLDGKAYAFSGKDGYGAVATFTLNKALKSVSFIVRQGGDKWTAKDPDADRTATVKDGAAEVWLASGKADIAYSVPRSDTKVVIHYQRPDGKYDGWDLWIWGDGLDGKAYPFNGTDAYGAVATFSLPKAVNSVSFIVRQGGDKWTAKDPDGDRAATVSKLGVAEVWLISGKADVFAKAPVTSLTIHYNRPDGKYDGWDLWVWGDGVDGKAYPFNGTDAYGAVATFTIPKQLAAVSFIVRQGGDKWTAKDPDGDRSLNAKNGSAEVWLASGKADFTYAPPFTSLVIHYSRPDNNYKDWDLWVWGDGLDGKAYAFTGSDDYGAVAKVTLNKALKNVSFIVRQGGDKWTGKDPDGDRSVTVKNGGAEFWLTSGVADIAYTKPLNGTKVIIHYSRPEGAYAGWDLWVWADGVDGNAYDFSGKNGYGTTATFTLPKKVTSIGLIVRYGGSKWLDKDPAVDRKAVVRSDGTIEVWLVSGSPAVIY